MTYSDFEILLLMALFDSADASERGQCEAFDVAETVLPQVKDQWVSDAVRSLVRIGDSLGIELYFAFKDNVAIAATAAA